MKISSDNNVLNLLNNNPSVNRKDISIPALGNIKIQNHHDTEVWLIHSGCGKLYSNRREIKIKSGDIIEFKPFDYHYLKNESNQELRLTTFWYVNWEEINYEIEKINFRNIANNILVGAAFPTPNGALHLGHISGPYLLSDIYIKYYNLLGKNIFSYSGTFGHQNHINRGAEKAFLDYDKFTIKYENEILNDLASCDIKYENFLPHNAYNNDHEFQMITDEFVQKLLSSSDVFVANVDYPFSESQQCFVGESYLSGNCPNCGATTISMECEVCGLFQDETKLINTFHSDSKEVLYKKNTTRLYLKIDRTLIDEIIVSLFEQNSITQKIEISFIMQYLENNFLNEIPISNFRDRGVPVYSGQMLTIPVERALRAYYNLKKIDDIDEHLFFCGLDNFCASGILIPYILKIIGVPSNKIPKIVINYMHNLEGQKFSTSKNHVIWVKDFLPYNFIDLVKFYLSKNFSKLTQNNFSRTEFIECCSNLKQSLEDIITITNSMIIDNHFTTSEAGQWTREDIQYYKAIKYELEKCMIEYSLFTPNKSVIAIEAIINIISLYCKETISIMGVVEKNYIRTRIALQLYGLKILAFASFPILTEFAKCIFDGICINIADFNYQVSVVNKFAEINLNKLLIFLKENYYYER